MEKLEKRAGREGRRGGRGGKHHHHNKQSAEATNTTTTADPKDKEGKESKSAHSNNNTTSDHSPITRDASRLEIKQEWEDSLIALDQAGFINAKKNIRLMHRFNGDAKKVREKLEKKKKERTLDEKTMTEGQAELKRLGYYSEEKNARLLVRFGGDVHAVLHSFQLLQQRTKRRWSPPKVS